MEPLKPREYAGHNPRLPFEEPASLRLSDSKIGAKPFHCLLGGGVEILLVLSESLGQPVFNSLLANVRNGCNEDGSGAELGEQELIGIKNQAKF